MSNQPTSEFNSRNVLEIVRRHRKKIVVLPLLFLAAGAAVMVFCPRTYQSESRIFLRIGRENIGLDPTVNTGQTLAISQTDRKDEVKSALEVLRSPSIAAAVVERLGEDVVLGRDAAPAQKTTVVKLVATPFRAMARMIRSLDPISDREVAIDSIQRNLDIHAERETTVIMVKAKAKTPQLAQTLCQAVVEVYQNEHMRIHRNEESRPFFTEQQKRLRKQLDEALESLGAAKNEMGLASIDQRQVTLESQFQALEADRLRTEQELATVQARIEELQQQLAKVPERVITSKKALPNEGADLLHQQLYELQIKSMDLAARYNDSHPLVQTVNAQLDEAKQVLAQQAEQRVETTDELNPIHRQLALDLNQAQNIVAGHKARLSELSKQKEAVLVDLRDVNDFQLQLDQLSLQADLTRDNYLQYARNLEEARIDQELENGKISNLSIVQAAMLRERPVSPSKRLVAGSMFLLAIFVTAAVVSFSEWRSDRFRSDRDIDQATKLPAQAAIPGARVRSAMPLKTNGQHQAVTAMDSGDAHAGS